MTVTKFDEIEKETFNDKLRTALRLMKVGETNLLQLYNVSNTGINSIQYIQNDSAGNETVYAVAYGGINSNTNGAEYGNYAVDTIQNGSAVTGLYIDETGFYIGGNFNLDNGQNIVLGTGSGTKIGTGTTQKLGFFNKTPIAQKGANADTSGATLGQLETEVNELKQLLRDYGLMA